MKFGFFDDQNKEYVITTPRTPLPWINYLGSKDFFSLISNTCGGYSFYKDAKLLRLTRYRYNNIPNDEGGRYFYIKEGDCVWNPGWQPVKTDLDSYECRHGMGYTKITSAKNGLKASLLAFVPVSDPCEINQLVLTNESKETKTFTLFSYLEFCLWNAMDDMTNFQRNLNIGEVEVIGSTIYHKTEYRERRKPRRFPRCLPRCYQSESRRRRKSDKFDRKRMVSDRFPPDQYHIGSGRKQITDLRSRIL